MTPSGTRHPVPRTTVKPFNRTLGSFERPMREPMPEPKPDFAAADLDFDDDAADAAADDDFTDDARHHDGRLAAPESVLDAWVGGGGRVGQTAAVRAQVESRPWGSVVEWANTESYAGRILSIRAGEAFSLHMHEERDETLYLLSGRVTLEAGPGLEAVRPVAFEVGESVRLAPGILHRVTAVEDAVLLEVATGEADDLVRVRDLYGRVSGSGGQ